MSRLSNLFRSSAARPSARKARLGVEALGDRLVPSVTFNEDTVNHVVTVTAGNNQSNNIVVVQDGNGGVRVTADGVVRNFTGVIELNIDTGNRADQVTYRQGTATQSVNQRSDFILNVHLGDNGAGTLDRFTGHVFGNVGAVVNGSLVDAFLEFDVDGGGGNDRIELNLAHDTDVRAGSHLVVQAAGSDGHDIILVSYDGELDGGLHIQAYGQGGDDRIAVDAQFDAGSTGGLNSGYGVDPWGGASFIHGGFGTDNMRFAVRQAAGAGAEVNAFIDGAVSLWDNDVGRHTTNVRTMWLEQDIVIV